MSRRNSAARTYTDAEVSAAFEKDVKAMPPQDVSMAFDVAKGRLDSAGIGRNISRPLFYEAMERVPKYGARIEPSGKIVPISNTNIERNNALNDRMKVRREQLDGMSKDDMQRLLYITYGGENTEAVWRLRSYMDASNLTMGGRLRIDDAAIFFARELEFLKTPSYDVLYPGTIYNRIMSIDSSASGGAQNITFNSYDFQGNAKITQNQANDVPYINVSGKQFTLPAYTVSVGCTYTFQMIREALFANKSLDAMLVKYMRMSVEQQIDRWAILGNAQYQLPGLLSIPGASAQAASVIPGTSNTTWAQKITSGDVALIQSDLLAGVQYIIGNTLGTQAPNKLVLPIDQYIAIFGTPRSNMSDTTVGSYFMQNNPSITEVYWSQWLSNAGSNNQSVYVMFNGDADRIQTLIPMPYTQHAPRLITNAYEITTETRFGGVACYYPNSVTYMVGI